MRTTALLLRMIVLGTLVGITPVRADQGLRVSGRVVGPGGAAVTDQNVVLHRVTSDGGVLLAEARTDGDGRFVLEADAPAPEGAVYFVAARYDDLLYIGPMLRPPLAPDSEVTLEVGSPERALGAAGPIRAPATLPGAATGTPRRWLLLIAPLAGLLGLIVWAVASAGGPSPERRLLIRIASLDNRHAEATDPAERAEYERRRRALLDRLDAAV